MRPRLIRSSLVLASVLASLAVPMRAGAGGAVVPVEGRSDPTVLDVRVAVAHSPTGTTRWSEVTVPAYNRFLWLVPARPGATIAWASNDWMPALDEATAPRIVKPTYSSTCIVQSEAERAPSWTLSATRQPPTTWTVHPTAESVRAAAASSGYAIHEELDASIASLYAAGWNLLAVEIQSSSGSTSTNTLRVSDDGGAALPLALVGSRAAETRVTAFTIGRGVMTTFGAIDVNDEALTWGRSGSNFATWRRSALQVGDRWLRESASHAVLFDGTIVPGGTPVTSISAQYLGSTACAKTAKNAGDSDSVVGASLPASTFACSGHDDLAIALDGLAPRTAVVTRWSGLVRRADVGVDRAFGFDMTASQSTPLVRAGSYESCVTSNGSSSSPITPAPAGGTGSPDDYVVHDDTDVVYVSDGCGGGTATTTTYEDETTTTTTDDGCSGDTSTTTTSSDDGWDSSDDSDSCDSDTSSSSSSSSDSCSGGTSDSGDGWDTEDDMTPSSRKTSLKTPKRSKSPFSRYALFAVALILPLRRRARAAFERR